MPNNSGYYSVMEFKNLLKIILFTLLPNYVIINMDIRTLSLKLLRNRSWVAISEVASIIESTYFKSNLGLR